MRRLRALGDPVPTDIRTRGRFPNSSFLRRGLTLTLRLLYEALNPADKGFPRSTPCLMLPSAVGHTNLCLSSNQRNRIDQAAWVWNMRRLRPKDWLAAPSYRRRFGPVTDSQSYSRPLRVSHRISDYTSIRRSYEMKVLFRRDCDQTSSGLELPP